MLQQIGQQFIIGLQGKTLTKPEADFIVKNNIGGVILFARNIESPDQLRLLCSEIQGLRHRMPDKAPLFISIDMEGGRVHRLPKPFTQWPAASYLGKLDSTSVAFRFASAMGAELKSVGINLNYAPCVDILTNPNNKAIGDRAIGADPELVTRIASAMVRGYIKSDILPCAKHFPGHGNTSVDSHDDLPVESRTLAEIENFELVPYKKVFRARLDLLMMAHIKFTQLDPEWPASLSEKIIKGLVRNTLRYRNLIITDDLGMGALKKHFSDQDIAVRALQAGVNILLYCNEPETPPVALAAIEQAITDKKLDSSVVKENYKKILDLKKEKLEKPEPLPLDELSRIVAHPDHLRLSKAIVAGEVPEDLLAT